MLDEREFELINIIGPEIESNQRDLSRHLDLSLGSTNMLIRRLITKGYIRIKQLNKRKVKYLLTPKGIAEKMNKSVKYTVKTINSLSLIKEQLKDKIILELYKKGIRDYVIVGKSDFALIIEMVFRELTLNDYTIKYLDKLPSEKVPGFLLICKEDINIKDYPFDNVVDLIHELAKNEKLINNHNY